MKSLRGLWQERQTFLKGIHGPSGCSGTCAYAQELFWWHPQFPSPAVSSTVSHGCSGCRSDGSPLRTVFLQRFHCIAFSGACVQRLSPRTVNTSGDFSLASIWIWRRKIHLFCFFFKDTLRYSFRNQRKRQYLRASYLKLSMSPTFRKWKAWVCRGRWLTHSAQLLQCDKNADLNLCQSCVRPKLTPQSWWGEGAEELPATYS